MSTAEPDFLDAYAETDADTNTPEAEEVEEEEGGSEEAEKGEKHTTEATPAEATDEDKGPVPYKAMKAERDKRQEREKRIAELEAELNKSRQPAKEEPKVEAEPEKTFWEDPDAYIASRLERAERATQQRLLVGYEDQMRETHKDYDEVIDKVKEYAQTNPAALQKILASANPAKAGYQFGKKLDELKQMEDPAAYRTRIEAEVRAQIAKEAEEEASGKARKADAIPPDLSSARNVGSASATKEPDPFKELFPRK